MWDVFHLDGCDRLKAVDTRAAVTGVCLRLLDLLSLVDTAVRAVSVISSVSTY